jgi:hypothetical protein
MSDPGISASPVSGSQSGSDFAALSVIRRLNSQLKPRLSEIRRGERCRALTNQLSFRADRTLRKRALVESLKQTANREFTRMNANMVKPPDPNPDPDQFC